MLGFCEAIGAGNVVSIFTPLLSTVVKRSRIGPVDQGLGFLFGVARGVLLVAVAYFLYQTILSTQGIPMIEDSRAAAVFGQIVERFQHDYPSRVTDEDVAERFARHGGNVREMLFDLYDLYETRRREAPDSQRE